MEMRGDEIFVLQHILHKRANLLAALDPRIFRQDPVTFIGKLLESITHKIIPPSKRATIRSYYPSSPFPRKNGIPSCIGGSPVLLCRQHALATAGRKGG